MSVTLAEFTADALDSRCLAGADVEHETTSLAVRAATGDPDAFGSLVALHHGAARRVALIALGNHAEAEEAVQDACLAAWKQIGGLKDPGAFRAWLLQITWRKALDRRRSLLALWRRVRSASTEEESPLLDDAVEPGIGPEAQLFARERDRAITRCIRALPPRLRDPFLLAVGGAHRYEEIASLLGLPLGTVKWRVAESRRIIREKLSRLGFGDLS